MGEKTQKQPFVIALLILVLMLVLLPFLTTFNDILTRFVMQIDFYKVIQLYIVPLEVRMVGSVLFLLGFHPAVVGEYLTIAGSQNRFFIEIAWNCIGWQSLLFFAITAFVGFQGTKYTVHSKLKAIVIGLLGTFVLNIFRMAIVVLVAYFFGQQNAQLFHDYAATLTVIAWLFVFWWFSYTYILDTKTAPVD